MDTFPKHLLLLACSALIALSSCTGKGTQPAQSDALRADDLFEAPVSTDFTRDTVVTFDTGVSLRLIDIGRSFPTDSSDVFMSLRVCALDESSPVNSALARIVDERYCYVTGGALFPDRALTPEAVADALDIYGRSFLDSVVPELDDAISFGFNITIDLRPVYATDDVVTYAVLSDYYTGGAHGDYDIYYATLVRSTGEELDFDQLVAPNRRDEVRSHLLSKMASDNDMDEAAYLKYLTEWTAPDESVTLTSADFPIYHVGLTSQGLAFAYPKYSIAPGSDGCPIYFVPTPK